VFDYIKNIHTEKNISWSASETAESTGISRALVFMEEIMSLKQSVQIMYVPHYVHLSPWHGMSLGCRWRRKPPNMEGSCKYIQ
jgi:hypothetical protein